MLEGRRSSLLQLSELEFDSMKKRFHESVTAIEDLGDFTHGQTVDVSQDHAVTFLNIQLL